MGFKVNVCIFDSWRYSFASKITLYLHNAPHDDTIQQLYAGAQTQIQHWKQLRPKYDYK